MRRKTALAIPIALLAAPAMWADVTLRYTLDFQLGNLFPAQAADTLRQALNTIAPSSIAQRIKGEKSYAEFGPITAVGDLGRRQVTLLSPKTKRYATIPMADLASSMVAVGTPVAQRPPHRSVRALVSAHGS